MGDKKLLFIGGCGRSGTTVLTEIVGAHQQIVLAVERFNKLMRKNFFSLAEAHFTKERFLTIYQGDTFYDDFNKFKAHENAAEKFDQAVYVGVKYPPFDRIYQLMPANFGTFKYLYIYRNIFDVAESWNRKAIKGGNWAKEKNYLKAVQRSNESLGNTLSELKNGADIICINYDDLLFTNKSIHPVFDRLGIPIDENVLRALEEARDIAPTKKSAKGSLSESEMEYIRNNAKFELYDEIHSKFNILRSTVVSGQRPGLILHIGTEKTGTTTIQEFLHLNRNLLADKGFYFPKSIGMRNHRPLASWCLSYERDDVFLRMNNLTKSARRKAWREDFLAKFEEELSGLKPQIKQVIISSEHFSSLLNHDAELETLKLLLDKWFTSITVVIYLRRQDSLMVSTYSTACQAGIIQESVLPDPAKLRPFVNYQKLLKKWSWIFGKENIIPRIFSPEEFRKTNLVQDFCHVCRLPEKETYIFPESKNLSSSETAQEVAQLFNRKFNQRNENRELSIIRKELLKKINAKYPGLGKKPLRHEAMEFYKYFEKSNNQVAREWFGREKLFNEDFSMYPEIVPVDKPLPDYEKILNEEIQPFSDVLKSFRNKIEN